jgi:hypothetical protein
VITTARLIWVRGLGIVLLAAALGGRALVSLLLVV